MNVGIYANYFILGPSSRGEEKQPCHHRRIRKSGPSLRREDEAVTPDVQLLPPRIRRWELWMERYVSIPLTLDDPWPSTNGIQLSASPTSSAY